MTPRRPTAALLMEHQAFLRRLAHSLVFDAQRAEDIVQDSFVVALERPMPAPARLRGWLAGIVRNGARHTLRGERRLRERHEHGARGEALGATADMAARLEAQRAIAAAVEALDEPGRSALVYRYFDGHKPARIARELGLPLRTVESRLRRAKEALRLSLDAQYGDRTQWQTAILPVIGLPAIGAGSLPFSSSAASTATGSGSASGKIAIGVAAMSAKSAIGFSLIAALAGGAVGWVAKPAAAPVLDTVAGDTSAAEDAGDDTNVQLGTDATVAGVELSQLRRALVVAREENEELKRALAAGASDAPVSDEAHLAAAEALQAPRFRHKKFNKGIEKADWKQVAVSIKEMVPLIYKFAHGAANGATDAKLQERVMALNMPLIQLAVTLKTAEIPGDGINGAYTHPLVTINMVYATLIEAGLPLSDTQTEQLEELGHRHIAEDEKLRAATEEQTFALATFLAESENKDRLYQAIDAVLTPDQRDALHPQESRDRMMTDLFSSGLIWIQHVQASIGTSREDVANKVTTIAMQQFQIPETERDAVNRLTTDWVQSFDAKDMAPLDAMERANFVRMSRARAAGRPMLTLYKELARELAAHPEIVKKLQEAAYVLLPVVTPQ